MAHVVPGLSQPLLNITRLDVRVVGLHLISELLAVRHLIEKECSLGTLWRIGILGLPRLLLLFSLLGYLGQVHVGDVATSTSEWIAKLGLIHTQKTCDLGKGGEAIVGGIDAIGFKGRLSGLLQHSYGLRGHADLL